MSFINYMSKGSGVNEEVYERTFFKPTRIEAKSGNDQFNGKVEAAENNEIEDSFQHRIIDKAIHVYSPLEGLVNDREKFWENKKVECFIFSAFTAVATGGAVAISTFAEAVLIPYLITAAAVIGCSLVVLGLACAYEAHNNAEEWKNDPSRDAVQNRKSIGQNPLNERFLYIFKKDFKGTIAHETEVNKSWTDWAQSYFSSFALLQRDLTLNDIKNFFNENPLDAIIFGYAHEPDSMSAYQGIQKDYNTGQQAYLNLHRVAKEEHSAIHRREGELIEENEALRDQLLAPIKAAQNFFIDAAQKEFDKKVEKPKSILARLEQVLSKAGGFRMQKEIANAKRRYRENSEVIEATRELTQKKSQYNRISAYVARPLNSYFDTQRQDIRRRAREQNFEVEKRENTDMTSLFGNFVRGISKAFNEKKRFEFPPLYNQAEKMSAPSAPPLGELNWGAPPAYEGDQEAYQNFVDRCNNPY